LPRFGGFIRRERRMEPGLRIDKWLWFARLCKSRSLAQTLIASGTVRLNGAPVGKPSLVVHPGDDILVPQGRGWRQVRVIALGERRGPASEAQALYGEGPAPALSPDGELISPDKPPYDAAQNPSS